MKKNESPDLSTSSLDPEKVKEAAAKMAEQAADFIKQNPFSSVSGALLVGVIVGMLIKRK